MADLLSITPESVAAMSDKELFSEYNRAHSHWMHIEGMMPRNGEHAELVSAMKWSVDTLYSEVQRRYAPPSGV